jgi:subtilisin family serine protease
MASKHVIVFFMHEDEAAAANQLVANGEATESFVVGEADDQAIANLRGQGLVVQELADTDQPQDFAARFETATALRRAPRARGRVWEARPIAQPPDLARPNVYLIQLRGPLIDKWRAALENVGVRLLEAVPPFTFTARLTTAQLQPVSALPFVNRVRLYDPADTRPQRRRMDARRGVTAPPPPEAVGAQMLTYDVRLHPGEPMDTVLDWLAARNVAVAGARRGKIRIYALETAAVVDELAALPQVALVEQYIEPELHNDVAREVLGIDPPQGANPAASLPYTGAGEIIGVADTGLDDGHPDFQGRIAGLVGLGRPGDSSDPHGHGTHVAGSVLGDGAASGGTVRGTAPGAQLFFQSLLDAAGGLGGLPLYLGDLFDEAYQAGARIHNNSWGAATGSVYTLNSIEVDEFVADHRDMLLVISAGNDGTAASPRNAQPGFVDWLSIGSPASSKNSLTVGASRSPRNGVGYANLTYHDAWPNDFPDPPIADEHVSGDPEAMAAFSSRGPCDDQRIKPDLVAPGTDIASARSSRAPARQFWGPYPGNSRYAYMGGTSMAAPLVAGCAALARQFYRTVHGHDPSAALLKATLINGTRWLSAADALADHDHAPNFHQGFGCLDMTWAVPNDRRPELLLQFVDDWQTPAKHLARTGARRRLQFHCDGGFPLRLCLAWTDPPGRALQHNLNLFLEHSPTRQKWIGNADLPLSITETDPNNNIEIIRIDDAPAGDYVLQVTATNLLHGAQDFALVVSGRVGSLTDF